MTVFAQINVYGRSFYLMLDFWACAFCFGLSLKRIFFRSGSIKTKNHSWVIPLLLFAVNFPMLFLLLTYQRSAFEEMKHMNRVYPEIAFGSMPWILCLILPGITILYLVGVLYRNRHSERYEITDSSIKESMDNLREGICFSTRDGRVLLSNDRINQLSGEFTGKVLLNAEEFWHDLKALDTKKNLHTDYVNLESDGKVWHFRRKEFIDKDTWSIKITALETTDLHSLSSELSMKNRSLSEMNHRLNAYAQNLEQMEKENEQVHIRNRIHARLGQLLMVSRYLLTLPYDAERETEILRQWHVAVSTLGMDSYTERKNNSKKQLIDAAQAAGIRLQMDGELPGEENLQSLLTAAVAEITTNAARHADAKQVFVHLEENADHDLLAVEFKNDGKPPKEPIRPGGGLHLLQERVRSFGGSFSIFYDPDFRIRIELPILHTGQKDDL